MLKAMLRKCKQVGFEANSLTQYLSGKRLYLKTLNAKKNQFMDTMNEMLSETSDSKSFWSVVRNLKRTGYQSCQVSPTQWLAFFKALFPPRCIDEIHFMGVLNPLLDSEISIEELECAINKSKPRKTPGNDCVPYEVFKNLPQNWKLYILRLFNKVLVTESVPEGWTKFSYTMIYKKGKAEDPQNYRNITLANCILKLFTQILLYRLLIWAEDTNSIPECQAGFRPGRGCFDNIFVINSLVQVVHGEKRRLYAAVIDFQRAFDSVYHNRLWSKLFDLGSSGKCIRIIKNIYDRASLTILDKRQEEVEITKGVLQGESLSPLLFSLFLADIESYYRGRGKSGIKISDNEDILLLLYADDLVIFGNSHRDLQGKLDDLASYCSENDLVLNVAKTKVIKFQGGRNPREDPFIYSGTEVELVSEVTYLGIQFSRSGVFLKAARQAITKARIAGSVVREICVKAKSSDWRAKTKLAQAMITSTLLYGSALWALRYLDMVESSHLEFYKRILSLNKSTPHYVVRLETGVTAVSWNVLQQALKWINKVLEMPTSRYPRKCLMALGQLAAKKPDDAKNNWLVQIRKLLNSFGRDDSLTTTNLSWSLRKKEIDDILAEYHVHLKQRDIDRMNASSFCHNYKHIYDPSQEVPQYLTLNIPFSISKIIAQIRTNNEKFLKINYRKTTHIIKQLEHCPLCNTNKPEDLYHILVTCPIYNSYRSACLPWLKEATEDEPNTFLRELDEMKVRRLYHYILMSLNLRQFILEE